MEPYVVSARKYRPQTFQSVVGQSVLTTTLKNAIAQNHLAHAYLFCGPRGVGKTTCARIFAKTINCMQPLPDGEACNTCESCKGFNEQRSFNIHELDAASNNSVDDIRSLVDQVRIPPQVGKYSVYIIDEVHMLSTAAFNAFLKTLEEPPAHAIFILATTEKHKIIPTILSRCQIYDFNRIRINDMVEYLQYIAEQEGITAEEEALNVIAQKADGAMRDALSIFDQIVNFCGTNVTYKDVIANLNVLDYEYYFRLVEHFLKGEITNSLLIFNEILNKGFDGQHFVSGLAAHFRNLLVSRDAETLVLLEVSSSVAQQYQHQAQQCAPNFIYKALEIANDCDLNYRQSKNKRLLVELLLIHLCQFNDNTPTPEKKELKPISETQPKQQPQQRPKLTNTVTTQKPISTKITEEKPILTSAPKSVSITAPAAAPQQPATAPKAQNASTEPQNEPFTEEALIAAWNSFAKTITDETHASNTMLNFPPHKNGNTCMVTLVNNLQQTNLENHINKLTTHLRKTLKNDSITVKITVDSAQVKKMAFTPSEKLNAMIEKKPEIATLKNQLNLTLL